MKIVTVYNQDIFFLELGLWPKANEKNVDFITFYHLKKQVVSVLGRYYVCFVFFLSYLYLMVKFSENTRSTYTEYKIRMTFIKN